MAKTLTSKTSDAGFLSSVTLRCYESAALRGLIVYDERVGILYNQEAQQMEYIALDSHKRYSFASIQNSDGKIRLETRVEHHPGAIRELLCQCEPESPVAVETIGNCY